MILAPRDYTRILYLLILLSLEIHTVPSSFLQVYFSVLNDRSWWYMYLHSHGTEAGLDENRFVVRDTRNCLHLVNDSAITCQEVFQSVCCWLIFSTVENGDTRRSKLQLCLLTSQ